MPYVAEKNQILTKVLGVNTRMDNESEDQAKVRQVVLAEMYNFPEKVDFLYLKQSEIWVKLDGNDFHLGDIRKKYADIINTCCTEIVRWNITGGYDLPTNKLLIAGQETVHPSSKKRANFGINICINLI